MIGRLLAKSDKPKRKKGYYWVYCVGEKIVAEWRDGVWWLCGIDVPLHDNEFESIGKKVK